MKRIILFLIFAMSVASAVYAVPQPDFNAEKSQVNYNESIKFISSGTDSPNYQPPQANSLPIPSLMLPTNNDTTQFTTVLLNWSSIAGALSYRVQVSTTINFASFTVNQVVGKDSLIIGGLAANTNYYWRVCAKDTTDSSSWSSVWTFKTMPAPSRVSIGNGMDYDLSQPFDRYYNYSTHEVIYHQSDLGTQKMINSIGYYKGQGTNTAQIENVSIYMKHTTSIEFTSGNYSLTGYSLVYQGFVPNNIALGWLDIQLANPFHYNGTNNLQILIIKNHQAAVGFFEAPAWRFSFGALNNQRSASSSTQQPTFLDALPFIPDVRFGFSVVPPSQNIALTSGWNMISANLTPQNSAMSNILSPLSTNMMLARNVYGQVYSPPFQNSLSNWNTLHAYQIRMNNPANLVLYGTPIVPELTPIALNQLGWYWLPYYRTSSMPVGNAVATISGKYMQIKSITGQVYQPPFATTLQNFEPNQGYMIRMIATDGTLTYPSNAIIKSNTPNLEIPEPKVFVREKAITSKTAFIALDVDNLQDGDEIGVFTSDGLLVGSSVWADGSRGVVVWGDDEHTAEKDGATEGEELLLKVWSASIKNFGTVETSMLNDMTNNSRQFSLNYETDGILLLKGAAEIEDISQISVSPQPATNDVFVRLNAAFDTPVSVQLFNQAGRLYIDKRDNVSAGVLRLNTSSIPSGVYQLIVNADGRIYTERIVIVR